MTLLEPQRLPLPALFADDLAGFGARTALITSEGAVSYADLDDRVRDRAAAIGTERRLVLVEAANAVEPLVAYLAALRGGHPVLLAPADDPGVVQELVDAYDPDAVMTAGGGWAVQERRAGTAHDLHPDLALLLSTSGSTGSSKLVRLSRRNLQANAESIARYLDITADDRAATTLPMQYCYGLSVIHSHLLRGAAVVLTGLSVVDRCFWDLFRAAGATSFAGVPHTFDLLDRVGFESMSLPTLRYVTQAGGRLHPDKVRRYATAGRRDGWRFFVMYGQTEATARMAYLPPELAATHPHAIGKAIPDGTLTVERPDADGVGELVYRGPNVMLGYAECPADLGLGATVDELRTGDLARVYGDGLVELMGRRSRFVKLLGLRIDLDRIERIVGSLGVAAMCSGDDDHVAVAVERGADVAAVSRLVCDEVGLPPFLVRVVELAELPRLANGKPDYPAVRREAAGAAGPAEPLARQPSDARAAGPAAAVRTAFADVLGADPAAIGDDDTFVGLGGDSLSYVEMSVRLEGILGCLPPEWHTTPIGRLVPTGGRRRAAHQVETSLVLRAVAIVLIVGTHDGMWYLRGGAHVLLGVAGFNFARFQLRGATRGILASAARFAVPSMCWIGLVAAVGDQFAWPHALLLNGLTVPDEPRHYWFIQTVVAIVLGVAALLAVRPVRRLERRWPFGFAFAVVLFGFAFRFDLFDLKFSRFWLSRPHLVLWLFALGWAAARATTAWRRLLVSAAVVLAVPGFFNNSHRELIVMGGLLALLWVRTVPLPHPVNRVVASLAGASLWIYLTHYQVWRPLDHIGGPLLASPGALLAGIAMNAVAGRAAVLVERRVRRGIRDAEVTVPDDQVRALAL